MSSSGQIQNARIACNQFSAPIKGRAQAKIALNALSPINLIGNLHRINKKSHPNQQQPQTQKTSKTK
jgi:hypothetical protein